VLTELLNMKTTTWNILTVVLIIGILLIGTVYTLIFVSPNIFFNPFPPVTIPPTPVIPTQTSTPLVFPPTWTNTPKATLTPTATNTPTPSLTNTPFTTPSMTITPTATGATLTPTASVTVTRDKTLIYLTGTATKTKKPTKTITPTPTSTKASHPGVFDLEGIADYATTNINTAVIIDVLANDFNLNPDVMHIVGITKSPTLGSVEISADRSYITYRPSNGAYGTDHFTYKFTDEAGWMAEGDVTVLILNPSAHAPTNITLSPGNVDENAGSGIVIGTFSSTDADTGDTFTYSFISGSGDADNSRFYITGDMLYTNQSFNAETQSTLHVRIRTTDSYHYTYDKALTIAVNNLNEFAPAFTSATTANATVGAAFSFTVTTSDGDIGDTRVITEVSRSPSPGWLTFVDNGNGTATLGGTPSDNTATSIVLHVMDAGGLSPSDQTLNITVTTP
jgi:hypothetical protein